MARREVSGKDLANRAGVSVNTISSIRAGRSCSDETGQAIAEALKVPVESLLAKGGL
ncbi:helix-turn-helix transcriptional regulator [Clostridia bacterium OttesenSCG-928-O13]|nr:helix-turn-helix transcriptional regulator [Clostridia bacterium OttesenSCG-928-O13]